MIRLATTNVLFKFDNITQVFAELCSQKFLELSATVSCLYELLSKNKLNHFIFRCIAYERGILEIFLFDLSKMTQQMSLY